MMKPVPEFNDNPYWSPPHPDIILESQSAEVGWEADQDSGGQKVWHSPLRDSISTDLQANVEWFSTWGLVGQLACWYFPQGWWALTSNMKAVLVSRLSWTPWHWQWLTGSSSCWTDMRRRQKLFKIWRRKWKILLSLSGNFSLFRATIGLRIEINKNLLVPWVFILYNSL